MKQRNTLDATLMQPEMEVNAHIYAAVPRTMRSALHLLMRSWTVTSSHLFS
jgi:hypothetical protein